MPLPFRKTIEPTEEQLLQFMPSDTRQTYEMAGMTAKQRADLRKAEVALFPGPILAAEDTRGWEFYMMPRRAQIKTNEYCPAVKWMSRQVRSPN
jgi:hypothetical protein